MTELNQRIAVTKRMVKEGLMRMLEKKPLEKINITELCQEAGINRMTFYRYYELPRDVLTEMQSEFFEETFEHFHKPWTASDIERLFCVCPNMQNLSNSFSNTIRTQTGHVFLPVFITVFLK